MLGMTGVAQATLTTIGTATCQGSEYNLIWDDDNNGNSVVWLDYSNERLNWAAQNAWASGLDGHLSYNIDSAYDVTWETGWRLGNNDAENRWGANITTSEMGHLFYEELGGIAGVGLPDDTGDFQNLVSCMYWFGLGDTHRTDVNDKVFNMVSNNQYSGQQYWVPTTTLRYGLALRTATVTEASPVPEPATIILFGTGFAGLAGVRRRKAKK